MAKHSQQRNRGQGSRSGQSGQGGGRRGGQGGAADRVRSADRCVAPYHFVPVEPDLAVSDAPIFHDVQQTGDDFWTGELRCTLEALTPLIAGNFQFECRHADDEVVRVFEEMIRDRSDGSAGEVKKEKKIIEPMRLGEVNGAPERVVIPGEAIKGAIRQSWQALLSAPMERVQERTFSFRPNLQTVVPRHCPIRDTRPALVVSVDTTRTPQTASVILLSCLQDVCYVHPDSVPHLPRRIQDLRSCTAEELESHYRTATSRSQLLLNRTEVENLAQHVALTKGKILKPRGPDPANTLEGWLPVVNLNGADTAAWLNARFHSKNTEERLDTKSEKGYPFVLVKLPPRATARPLDAPTISAYFDSIRHLGDQVTGHLRDHPLIEKREEAEQIHRRLQKFLDHGLAAGNLLFIEQLRLQRNAQPKIVSVGHHFYHRQRYRDSVRLAGDPWRQDGRELTSRSDADRLRSVLCPPTLEQTVQMEVKHQGAPKGLTGARGLFGYVAQHRHTYTSNAPNEPLDFGIAREHSDFKQLAGRVSVNWAVEQPREDGDPRFLNEDRACLVPLRPLSAPKASAVEMYLTQDRLDQRQDGGSLCTYGESHDDSAAGGLRGRKFYLHQPDAAQQPNCYELTGTTHPDWYIGPRERNNPAILSDQAGIARFVSVPGTTFKFTIRFRDLRAWELGALFLVLATDLDPVCNLLELLDLKDNLSPRFQGWLDLAQRWQQQSPGFPLLAMKVGHGRPLGLGSVQIKIDSIRRIWFDRENGMIPTPKDHQVEDHQGQSAVRHVQEAAILAFATKLLEEHPSGNNAALWVEKVLLPWLQVHRYAGRTNYDYPRGPNGQARTGLIYEYHSQQRQNHARGRKLPHPEPEHRLAPGGLMTLDELDEHDLRRA